MPSIHDSLLTGYNVDGIKQTVVLHTEPHSGGGEAFIDIIFDGVVAYDFEGDCLQNIVFGVEVVPFAMILGDHAFLDKAKRYGWPRGWDMNKETPESFFKRLDVRAYELTSSYGIHGWIAAKSMHQVVHKAKPAG